MGDASSIDAQYIPKDRPVFSVVNPFEKYHSNVARWYFIRDPQF